MNIDWNVNTIYNKGDITYYYNHKLSGTFISNIDNNNTMPDNIDNGFLTDYPNCYWTLIALNLHSDGTKNYTGNGKGNWSTESQAHPYNINDIVHYYNGGIGGSFISNVNNNTVEPDNLELGYLISNYYWSLLELDI